MRGKASRAGIREAVAECSSSRTLGEYAVSARSDIRSITSLPPHKPWQNADLYSTSGKEDHEEADYRKRIGDLRKKHKAEERSEHDVGVVVDGY